MNKVLCVDLDGTLINDDLLIKGITFIVKNKPYLLPACVFKLLLGKHRLKDYVASKVPINLLSYKYNQSVLNLLFDKRKHGYKVYLVSGAAIDYVRYFYFSNKHLFCNYYASNQFNLVGIKKAHFLNLIFGVGGYEYVGNSKDDIPCFNSSSLAYCVLDKRNKDKILEKLLISYVRV